ncbi:uncharacterized protein LOC135922148 isoform X2 [Gordionus sp. m RMFG-2023]
MMDLGTVTNNNTSTIVHRSSLDNEILNPKSDKSKCMKTHSSLDDDQLYSLTKYCQSKLLTAQSGKFVDKIISIDKNSDKYFNHHKSSSKNGALNAPVESFQFNGPSKYEGDLNFKGSDTQYLNSSDNSIQMHRSHMNGETKLSDSSDVLQSKSFTDDYSTQYALIPGIKTGALLTTHQPNNSTLLNGATINNNFHKALGQVNSLKQYDHNIKPSENRIKHTPNFCIPLPYIHNPHLSNHTKKIDFLSANNNPNILNHNPIEILTNNNSSLFDSTGIAIDKSQNSHSISFTPHIFTSAENVTYSNPDNNQNINSYINIIYPSQRDSNNNLRELNAIALSNNEKTSALNQNSGSSIMIDNRMMPNHFYPIFSTFNENNVGTDPRMYMVMPNAMYTNNSITSNIEHDKKIHTKLINPCIDTFELSKPSSPATSIDSSTSSLRSLRNPHSNDYENSHPNLNHCANSKANYNSTKIEYGIGINECPLIRSLNCYPEEASQFLPNNNQNIDISLNEESISRNEVSISASSNNVTETQSNKHHENLHVCQNFSDRGETIKNIHSEISVTSGEVTPINIVIDNSSPDLDLALTLSTNSVTPIINNNFRPIEAQYMTTVQKFHQSTLHPNSLLTLPPPPSLMLPEGQKFPITPIVSGPSLCHNNPCYFYYYNNNQLLPPMPPPLLHQQQQSLSPADSPCPACALESQVATFVIPVINQQHPSLPPPSLPPSFINSAGGTEGTDGSSPFLYYYYVCPPSINNNNNGDGVNDCQVMSSLSALHSAHTNDIPPSLLSFEKVLDSSPFNVNISPDIHLSLSRSSDITCSSIEAALNKEQGSRIVPVVTYTITSMISQTPLNINYEKGKSDLHISVPNVSNDFSSVSSISSLSESNYSISLNEIKQNDILNNIELPNSSLNSAISNMDSLDGIISNHNQPFQLYQSLQSQIPTSMTTFNNINYTRPLITIPVGENSREINTPLFYYSLIHSSSSVSNPSLLPNMLTFPMAPTSQSLLPLMPPFLHTSTVFPPPPFLNLNYGPYLPNLLQNNLNINTSYHTVPNLPSIFHKHLSPSYRGKRTKSSASSNRTSPSSSKKSSHSSFNEQNFKSPQKNQEEKDSEQGQSYNGNTNIAGDLNERISRNRIPESPDYGLGSDVESANNVIDNDDYSSLVEILSNITDILIYNITAHTAIVKWKSLLCPKQSNIDDNLNIHDNENLNKTPFRLTYDESKVDVPERLPSDPFYKVYLYKKSGNLSNYKKLCSSEDQKDVKLQTKAEILINDISQISSHGICVYNGCATECSLDNLTPYKDYEIRIGAYIDTVKGRISNAVSFKSLSTIPDTPEPPILLNRTKNSMSLKWTNPLDNGSKITEYSLLMTSIPASAYINNANNVEEHYSTIYTGDAKHFKACKLKPGGTMAYRFRISVANAHGTSPVSDPATFFTPGVPPLKPDSPRLLKATPSTLNLSWPASLQNQNQTVSLQMEDTNSGHGFLPVLNYNRSNCSEGQRMEDGSQGDEDENGDNLMKCLVPPMAGGLSLKRNTAYNFKLRVSNDDGHSPWSDIVTYKTLPAPPGPPRKLALKIKPSPTSLKLSWASPSDNGGSVVQLYSVDMKSNGHPFVSIYSGPDKECGVECLSPGTAYIFRVKCESLGGGEGSFSRDLILTTPAAAPSACCTPTLSPLESIGAGKRTRHGVTIIYDNPESDGGSPITEYEVEMCHETAKDNKNSESYNVLYKGILKKCVVNDLLPANNYRFRVRAGNVIGWGVWSNWNNYKTGAGPPNPPTLTVTIKSSFSAAMTFRPPENDNSTYILEYVLEMAKTLPQSQACLLKESHLDFIKIYNGPDTIFECKNLIPCNVYYFRVAATNVLGQGVFSLPLRIMTPPSVPTCPASSNIISLQKLPRALSVQWKPPTDDRGSPVLKYGLEVNNVDSKSESKYFTTETDSCQYNVKDLRPIQTYRIRIQAINAVGTGPFSGPINFTTPPDIPSKQPVIKPCSSSLVGYNFVKVRWEYPELAKETIICPDTLTYELEMADYRKCFNCVYVGDALSCKVTKLHENSVYDFRVRSFNESGYGPFSSNHSFKTSWAPPSTVKSVKVTRCKQDSCYISWVYPTHFHAFPQFLQSNSKKSDISGDNIDVDYHFHSPSIKTNITWDIIFEVYLNPSTSNNIKQDQEIIDYLGSTNLSSDIEDSIGTDFILVYRGNQSECFLKHLTPSTEYKFKVAAVRLFYNDQVIADHHMRGPLTQSYTFKTSITPGALNRFNTSSTLVNNAFPNDLKVDLPLLIKNPSLTMLFKHPAYVLSSCLSSIYTKCHSATVYLPSFLTRTKTGIVDDNKVTNEVLHYPSNPPKSITNSSQTFKVINNPIGKDKTIRNKKNYINHFDSSNKSSKNKKKLTDQQWALIIICIFTLAAVVTTFLVAKLGNLS